MDGMEHVASTLAHDKNTRTDRQTDRVRRREGGREGGCIKVDPLPPSLPSVSLVSLPSGPPIKATVKGLGEEEREIVQ